MPARRARSAGSAWSRSYTCSDHGDILDGLNEQQRRAVTHQGGALLVLAGAGTGKTRTLVARAAWLRYSQGVRPAGSCC